MKKLTSADSLDELLTQQEYSLIYFSAPWCGPCKSMSPIVEGISSMMNDRFTTFKVDIDSTPTFAADYGVRSIPALMLVKNDEVIDQRVGSVPPQELIHWLGQLT